MNSNKMDSNQTQQAVEQQQRYQPKTLKQPYHGRYAYLPSFPITSFDTNESPLLANVPGILFCTNSFVFSCCYTIVV